MRPKVYGRRAGAPSGFCRDVFTTTSSPKKPTHNERQPLGERSANTLSSLALIQKDEKNKPSDTSLKKAAVKSASSLFSTPRPDPTCITFPQECPSNSDIDSLTTALSASSLLNCQEAIAKHNTTRPREPSRRKAPLPNLHLALRLEPRPARITTCTRQYLQPILACRNVSPVVEDFEAWLQLRESSLRLQKIGEGSFGEVYRASALASKNTTGSTGAQPPTVIFKIIPLNAARGPNSRCFTSVDAAATELRLLERMQRVPGFVEFRGAAILQGRMPATLGQMWEMYRQSSTRTVVSRDPRSPRSYSASQLWCVVEMSDAGQNLEHDGYQPLKLQRQWSRSKETKPSPIRLEQTDEEKTWLIRYAWDIFWQVVIATAKAEVYASFEHRDLHLGNICVYENRSKVLCAENLASSNDESDSLYAQHGELDDGESDAHYESDATLTESKSPFALHKTGVVVTIIDYSLSRASMPNGEILAYDIQSDKDLFSGEGDLQYDMYRAMGKALESEPSNTFQPRTNIVWLWFVLHKLLERSEPGGSGQGAKSEVLQVQDEANEAIRHRQSQPLSRTNTKPTTAQSAVEPAPQQGYEKSSRQQKLKETASQAQRRMLEELHADLDPERMDDWKLASASQLVNHAVETGWIFARDVLES